jgi:hypothetical protein
MTRWVMYVVGCLAAAAASASTHYEWLAEQNHKPGQHRVDRNFTPPRHEYFTPEGQFYLRLSRWLKVAAFVIAGVWLYLLIAYR